MSVTFPVALITGAAQGIGLATANEFASRGYGLVLWDSQLERLTQQATALAIRAPLVLARGLDLADLASGRGEFERVRQEVGRIDVLVNNAAWRELKTMRQISVESWDRTLRICLTAPAFLARWAAELMEPRGTGVIINVSSIRAFQPDGLAAAYTAAKAGLDGLTYDLAALYGRSGIRVVGVNPGAVDTALSQDYQDADGASLTTELRQRSEDHIPLGRWAQAEEIARAIAWLASDEASYITGTTLTIDGGWTRNGTPQSLKRKMAPGDFR